MRVVEIFSSIEGEGIRAGELCTFIRLEGCNLRCSYCDTQYSYNNPDTAEMSIEQIVDKCLSYDVPNVTITGGEPLIHPGVAILIKRLWSNGLKINIETNGSINLDNAMLDKCQRYNVFFTMDYKCPSSGVENRMNLENLHKLTQRDVLKFVVGSQEDLFAALDIIDSSRPEAHIYFSPVWGKIEPVEIVNFMKEHNLTNVRLQIQLHKIVWNPQERGV